jgi:hypothetical protein
VLIDTQCDIYISLLTSNLIITRFFAQSLISTRNRPHPHHFLKLKVTSYISFSLIIKFYLAIDNVLIKNDTIFAGISSISGKR